MFSLRNPKKLFRFDSIRFSVPLLCYTDRLSILLDNNKKQIHKSTQSPSIYLVTHTHTYVKKPALPCLQNYFTYPPTYLPMVCYSLRYSQARPKPKPGFCIQWKSHPEAGTMISDEAKGRMSCMHACMH